METEGDELETLRIENNKLKAELDEYKVKVRILEEETSVAGEISQEDINALTKENEAEILEVLYFDYKI